MIKPFCLANDNEIILQLRKAWQILICKWDTVDFFMTTFLVREMKYSGKSFHNTAETQIGLQKR